MSDLSKEELLKIIEEQNRKLKEQDKKISTLERDFADLLVITRYKSQS